MTLGKTRIPPRPESFDVVIERTIGTVALDGGADHPHVVAFRMIAENDEPGRYRFPLADGGTCIVTVDYQQEPPA